MDTNVPTTGIGRALAKEAAPPSGVPSPGASARPDLSAIKPDAPGTPSVFDWISLARATWTWLLRPLWYICVVFPCKFCFAMLKANARTQEEEDRRLDDEWYTRRQQEEYDRKYNGNP